MTCIVSLVEKNGDIYFGGDCSGLDGWSLIHREDEKVFIKDNMIFGFTSSFRMGQLIRYKLDLPLHPKGCSDTEYMVVHFIEALRECFRVGGYTEKTNERESGGHFLVGYNKKVFHIGMDFQVGQRMDNFDSVGIGSDHALASLFSTKNIKDTKERLQISLSAAEYLNCGVHAPFRFVKLPAKKKT